MESYAKGDRVSLREPLGTISPRELGVVVEVYRENETPDGAIIGTKDFETHGAQTLFDYGVMFGSLGRQGASNGAWRTREVDLSQFAIKAAGRVWGNANIIPVAHDELEFIDSALRSVFK